MARLCMLAWLATTALAVTACDSSVAVADRVYGCTTDLQCRAGHKCLDSVCKVPGALTADITAGDMSGGEDGAADVVEVADTADVVDSDTLGALATLCMPCAADADCSAGGLASKCLNYGEAGSFCGADCAGGLPCPDDYTCVADQCRRTAGECTCPAYAADHANATTCYHGDKASSCTAQRKCVAGVLGPCDAPSPATETCNNVDDDCDAATDEDFAMADPATGKTVKIGEFCGNQFACSKGVVACQSATQVSCATVKSVFDECNGKDDNCDGHTDEGFAWQGIAVALPCTASGVCGQGTVLCASTGGAICSSLAKKVAEACNGLDDDCDGATDEDFVWLDAVLASDLAIGATCTELGACGVGTVECGAAGKPVCSSGKGGSQSGVGGESCNGLDDDCDGATDEDFPLQGKPFGAACDPPGQCAAGLVECDGATASKCSTGKAGSQDQSQPEACNGLDDDCDGITDNGFMWLGTAVGLACDATGACGVGLVACGADGVATCSSGPGGKANEAKPEACNALDDDCDGLTDEDCVDADKDGFCAGNPVVSPGFALCQAAGDCSDGNASVHPQALDTCNLLDDDCDGSTDNPVKQSGFLTQECYEGAGDTLGVGLCQQGKQTCNAGKFGACVGQVMPQLETCDNKLDDDCDSKIDNGCLQVISQGQYAIGCPESGEFACKSDELPAFSTNTPPFSIEPNEVSVFAYAACVKSGTCTAPGTGGLCNWGVAGKESHPANCVDWNQASTFCSWRYVNGQLPSELQWEYVASGTLCSGPGKPPNGPCKLEAGLQFTFSPSPVSCNIANYDDGLGCGVAGTVATTAGVPQKPFGMSSMTGNVAEWTGSWYGSYPTTFQGPFSGTERAVRGGSYASGPAAMQIWARDKAAPSTKSPTIGFRCAKIDPK